MEIALLLIIILFLFLKLNAIEEKLKNINTNFEKIEKDRTKNIEVRNYFLTTNFSNQNYSFKENEVFKDKTLYNKKNVILSDYWNVSGITATHEEQQIIDTINERE